MHVLPYPGHSDVTTYLSDNSKALYGVRSRRITPQYTLIQNVPLSEWTNKISPRHSIPSPHAIFHYNTHTHDLIAKSIAEGHDHLTRFFTTWFMCQFLDMGLNTPGAWVDMHSSIVTLGEWERQMDSRWAPPAKKGPLSAVLEVGCLGSAGKGDFEDDVRRWIECGGSRVECVVAFCVDVLWQRPRPWVLTVTMWEPHTTKDGDDDNGTRKARAHQHPDAPETRQEQHLLRYHYRPRNWEYIALW